MSMKILTAYTGDAHIESADDGAKFAGIIGIGKYILNVGSKFEAEIVSNNLIKIKDGDLVNQGRHMRIPVNETVECTIDNGTQSRYRNDLIVARYSKDSNTGIESVNVVVIKGTASTSSSPADPTYTSGDILNGALTDDFPLYRVRLNGLSITAVEPLFGDPVKSLSEVNTDMRKERTFTAWRTIVFARGDGRYVSMFIPGAFVAESGSSLKSDAPIKISPYGQEITLTNPTITQDDTGIHIISDLGSVEFGTTEACLLTSTFTIR